VLLAEREQFDHHLGALCAGFNVPFTDHRREGYWVGLNRMELSAFIRVVNHALSDQGPEKFPTVRDVWGLHKVLQRKRYDPQPTRDEPAKDVDDYTAFANRRLLKYLMETGAVTDAALTEILRAKARLVADARAIEEGGDQFSEEEFAAELRRVWAGLHVPRTPEEILRDRQKFCFDNKIKFMGNPWRGQPG
jgi:hypothetical protein